MKDENGSLCMSFDTQNRLCNAVLHMPLDKLRGVASLLSQEDADRLYRKWQDGFFSICVYRAFLALIIFNNSFMRDIFEVEEAGR